MRDWDTFNKALLGKWRWRILNESNSLWVRVLKAKYSIPLPLNIGGMEGKLSYWWKDIFGTCFSMEETSWFDLNVRLKLGDVGKVRFWQDAWLGQCALNDKFARLYYLSVQQHALISDVGTWENGEWKWILQWRRPILPCEEEGMAEFHSCAQAGSIVEGREDKWTWTAADDGVYTVSSALKTLQGLDLEEPSPVFSALWRVAAPSNVLAFGWRIFWGRLQMKQNLQKKGHSAYWNKYQLHLL